MMPAPNHTVDTAARAIVNQSANAVTSIVTGVATHWIMGQLPIAAASAHGAFAVVVDQFQELEAELAIDQAIDAMDGRVSRIAGLAIKRAKRLLFKILGQRRQGVISASRDLLREAEGKPHAIRPTLAYPMALLFSEGKVIVDGSEALAGVGWVVRHAREHRLQNLQGTNERWVGPVKWLSHGLGPLWLVILPPPVGPMPVAPIAAAVLFVWTVLVTGDQLDSPGLFPDFWKGVVRRSNGA